MLAHGKADEHTDTAEISADGEVHTLTEHDLQNAIRAELTKRGYTAFRANVGKVKMPDGRYFSTGLPRGFSDVFAVKDGRISFIEVKVHPNKPTAEQLNFIAQMQRKGCDAGVAYSVEDAISIVEGAL